MTNPFADEDIVDIGGIDMEEPPLILREDGPLPGLKDDGPVHVNGVLVPAAEAAEVTEVTAAVETDGAATEGQEATDAPALADLNGLPVSDIRLDAIETVECELSDTMVAAFQAGMRLIQPVFLKQLPDGTYKILDGIRRVASFRELERETIPAMVVPSGTDETTCDVYGLALNGQRSPNEHKEAELCLRLYRGREGRPGMTPMAIHNYTGLPYDTIKRHLRKVHLTQEVLDIWHMGGITSKTADTIAWGLKGDEDAQGRVAETYRAKLEEDGAGAKLEVEDLAGILPTRARRTNGTAEGHVTLPATGEENAGEAEEAPQQAPQGPMTTAVPATPVVATPPPQRKLDLTGMTWDQKAMVLIDGLSQLFPDDFKDGLGLLDDLEEAINGYVN